CLESWISMLMLFFFFSSRRRHTRFSRDWSSDVCSSDLQGELAIILIRIAISLDALTGGEAKWMQHFMKSPNKLTKGIPIKQIQTTHGLATVLNVVEGLRLQGKY